MSALPGFDTPPAKFKHIKKGEEADSKKKDSVHKRVAITTKRYHCGYLLDSGDPCPKAFDIKTAKISHEKTHRKGKIESALGSDILHIEVPLGRHQEWIPDYNFYLSDEGVKLPEGYKVIHQSSGVKSRDIQLPNMVAPQPMSFYEMTLVRDSASHSGIDADLKKTITELKRRLTMVEKQVKSK